MILITVDDHGYVSSYKNILAYDILTKEDVDNALIDMGLGVTLTDEEMEIIKHRLGKFEHFPDLEDLRWLIKDVLSERTAV